MPARDEGKDSMSLRLQAFEAGPVQTNAYLVTDDETNEALIVDAPHGVTDDLIEAARRAGSHIGQIVITHTHWDHIADAAVLAEATGAPLLAHPLAVEPLARPGSALFDLPFSIPPVKPDRLLKEGDDVQIGAHTFRVLHLPGHDPAHIVLFSEPDRIFLGGDVVFPEGHGRIDIPGADVKAMNHSLARVAQLPPETVIYPGHGRSTTIGEEAWLLEHRDDGSPREPGQ